jgi:hypothetical protein
MKLGLALRPEWPCSTKGKLRVITLAPQVTMAINDLGPFEALPRDLFTRGVPKGCTQSVLQKLDLRTETGWPVRCMLSSFARDGVPTETQLDALYAILVYGAFVRVRAESWAAYEAARATILAVLTSARPRLSGGRVAGIHELWDMAPEAE